MANSSMNAPTDYGVINFIRNRREAKADFLRVPDDILVPKLLKLMVRQWRLAKPGIIVQVTGSAQGFDLPSKFVQPITEGIVYAASVADAWIMTGGMDAGVMSLIGSSIARYRHKCDNTPVIGIGSWRGVQNNHMLENACGQRVSYYSQGANTPQAAGLEPNHTQFLLVDKEEGGVFGAELDILEKLQHQLKNDYSAPTVLLVIQGGPGTLDTMLRCLRQGIVTVLAADSGKLASAFATYMREDIIPPEWQKHEATFAEIRNLNEQKANHDDLTGTFDEKWPLVQLFYLRGRDHIGEAVLEAVLKQSSLEQRLDFAVRWNRADLLESQLASIPSWQEERKGMLQSVLQKALELERPDMVQAALHHGAPAKKSTC